MVKHQQPRDRAADTEYFDCAARELMDGDEKLVARFQPDAIPLMDQLDCGARRMTLCRNCVLGFVEATLSKRAG